VGLKFVLVLWFHVFEDSQRFFFFFFFLFAFLVSGKDPNKEGRKVQLWQSSTCLLLKRKMYCFSEGLL
jgi:hypothetical protein